MQYNIIGDIHGRNVWKELVREDCINIFVGDYVDPYPQEDISDEAAWTNFMEILHYRNQHPDTTILLWGNHDLHYIFPKERYSRYCRQNGEKMQGLYHKGLLRNLQLSYTIGDHTLVTHAGVTKEWWNMVCRLLHRALPATPAFVGKLLNTFAQAAPEQMELLLGTENTFLANDIYGNSPTASPIWVRPKTLVTHNLFAGTHYRQIVGHTQVVEQTQIAGITFTDYLGQYAKSHIIL